MLSADFLSGRSRKNLAVILVQGVTEEFLIGNSLACCLAYRDEGKSNGWLTRAMIHNGSGGEAYLTLLNHFSDPALANRVVEISPVTRGHIIRTYTLIWLKFLST